MLRLLIKGWNWDLISNKIFKMKITSLKINKSLITTKHIICLLEILKIQQLIDKVRIYNLHWVFNYKIKKTII